MTRRLPPDVEVVVYRVVQEALTNVARHAHATRATVTLAETGGRVRLVVEDDGRGTSREARPHLGWLGMQERVTTLGGTLAIGPAASGGVRVEAALPLEAA